MKTRTLLRSTAAAATAASSSGVLVKAEQEPVESVIAERNVTLAPLMQAYEPFTACFSPTAPELVATLAASTVYLPCPAVVQEL